MVTRTPDQPGGALRFGRNTVATFGVLLALGLFGALFPWFPGEARLDLGATASRTIVAPSDRSYESALQTEALREQRAATVPDVLVQVRPVADS